MENPQQDPGMSMFYNIDSEIGHLVFLVTDVKDLHGGHIDQFQYITPMPTLKPIKQETKEVYSSPYWIDKNRPVDEIMDEHLIT